MKLSTILFVSVLCGLLGCTDPGVDDNENDSFGGNAAKADGSGFDPCEVTTVLAFVNEGTTTVDLLRDNGLSSRAAEALIDHRNGVDGDGGTADDDLFDDLQELDDVRFIGPVSLGRLIASVSDRCTESLDQPFISASTFDRDGTTFGRDNTELEAAYAVQGVTGTRLNAIVNTVDSEGRTLFRRFRDNDIVEAFTLSYDVEEVPWGSDAFEARESIRYVPLTIESGRFDIDPDDGRRVLSLGTDFNDDIYFDNKDFLLLKNAVSYRGRFRWDNATTVRRLLVATKFGATVDDAGIKRAAKIDVRRDSPSSTQVDTFASDARLGVVDWSGTKFLQPTKDMWEALVAKDLLPDVGAEEKVLFLKPQAYLRSVRSRLHYNVPTTSQVAVYQEYALDRVQDVVDMAQAALDAGIVASGDRSLVESLIEDGDALVGGNALRAQISGAEMPKDFASTASDMTELENNKQIAEAADRLFHNFAEKVNDADRIITGTDDLDYDDFVDMFETWRKAEDSSLTAKRTHRPFMLAFAEMEANRADTIADFNTYAAAQLADGNDDFEDFVPANDEIWDALAAHLQYESLRHMRRQIAYGGTVSHMFWFEQARRFYVPSSSRPSGNAYIDTFDFTQMISATQWDTIPESEKSIDDLIDPTKVFHSTMVNEVQFELRQETPYIERIAELEALVADGSATAEDEANLAGAQFVLDQWVGVMEQLAQIKGDAVVDRLQDNGAADADWGPSEYSKGDTALRVLADIN